METWRLIISEPLTGTTNMAIDEAIMHAVSSGQVPPTIRFYRWSPPAITLGYFQSLAKEVDTEACSKAGIDVVRRLTGGRAVLHHRELTYSLVAPENQSQVAGTILQSYLAISRGLVAGLAQLGVTAEITTGKKERKISTAACFDTPSHYELVVGGKKLVGSAQTRRQGCLLQHGSILTECDAELLFSVLNFSNDKVRERAKGYFSAHATSLLEILGYAPEFGELCEAFGQGFMEALGIRLEEGGLTAGEESEVLELCVGKYGTRDWNGRR